MEKDITICIGTVGYPTFQKCYKIAKNIYNKDNRVKDVVVIKNKYPTSAWLNEMRSNQKTTWVLQLDEDMYIYKNCIDVLLDLAKKSEKKGTNVLNASALLKDLFLNSSIGSIKLWNTDVFQLAIFKNVLGSDRQFAREITKMGFSNVETHQVIADHDSAPCPAIAYFKYKEYLAKIKEFQSEKAARGFLDNLKKISSIRKDNIGEFAYEGGLAGLSFKKAPKTKNFLDIKNSRELDNLLIRYNLSREKAWGFDA